MLRNPPPKRRYYHFIPVVYKRTLIFEDLEIRKRVKDIFIDIAEQLGLRVFSIFVAKNHVHILVERNEQITLKYTSQRLFAVSSLLLRREFPQLLQMHEKRFWGSSNKRVYVKEEDLTFIEQYIKNHSLESTDIES
jgi:REP element-mobilizing transposase RayT